MKTLMPIRELTEADGRALASLCQAWNPMAHAQQKLSDSLPTVMAEELPLTLLFQNLIGNAIKYCTKDQPPRIRVSAGCSAGAWNFSVTDNGIGIDAENLETIVAPFKCLHGREYPGTGLGLAMCRKIVERYPGRIWVESTMGQGSTFHFTLSAKGGDEWRAAHWF